MSTQTSAETLPAWARLNGVDFVCTKVENVAGKGLGLFTTVPFSSNHQAEDERPEALLRIPRDLILSAEAIEDYSKVDHNFRQLLDKVGLQSTRRNVLLYLLVHLNHPVRSQSQARGVAQTSWTEYIQFLPSHVPLPTLWTEAERELLIGTSLESAVEAKLTSLSNEFDHVRDYSSELPFWQAYLWEKGTVGLNDWVLLDAWYRSRSLELPHSGEAMVPCLDMANHSHQPNSFYEESNEGVVSLLVRPGCSLANEGEVTISYGDAKPAAEMLFSYGFIDSNMARSEMKLPIEASDDDPLARAKLHAFKGPHTVRLSRIEGIVQWDSPLVHLLILNEEDGLDFRVLQDMSGERELHVFWQDQNVTSQTDNFERLVQDHPLCPVFRLRAVAILYQILTDQLERIQAIPVTEAAEQAQSEGYPAYSEGCVTASRLLEETETSLLKDAVKLLENQQHTLLSDKRVKAYLGLTEDTQNDQASPNLTNEEPDFS